MDQKQAFLEYEGDGWFQRNSRQDSYSVNEDIVISLLKEYKVSPVNFLEIGCSAGYRVNGIKKTFPNAASFGIDASKKAIDSGNKMYPDVDLMNGTADNLSAFKDAFFDVVVVGFVFYVIDREVLLKTISEIDRVLQDKGFVVILDFNTNRSLRNSYQHIKDFEAFSYKQRYESLFLSTGMYQLLDKSTRSHTDTTVKESSGDYQNQLSLVLLKKDVYGSY